MWAYETTFYQIYPLGFCGAPRENAAPVAEDELAQAANAAPNPDAPKYGQIQEWAKDYEEVEIGHRHISHLFALYPADLITPYHTPELGKAARATLIRRLIHGWETPALWK